MALKDMFRSAPAMDGAQARKYMQEHDSGSYTLLDVRQRREYEEGHIPGALLIPLPQLSDGLGELAKDRPTVVYCAIGGRSEMAARFLIGQGFREVYNLRGGIKAWRGETVVSPVDRHLPLLEEHAGVERLAQLALQMEAALGKMYGDLAATAQDAELKKLLLDLASAEQAHEKGVVDLAAHAGVVESALRTQQAGKLIEGGFEAEAFLRDNADQLGTREGVLELAMMVEAHALDLYLCLAQRVPDEASRTLLHGIADEEKQHLRRLGQLRERAG